jgi:arylsulfatase A-like enzyme
MNKEADLDPANTSPGTAKAQRAADRLSSLDVLVLSLGCGLAAGLLEVATRVACRTIDPAKRLYLMSRHFVWLTPLANLLFFALLGVVLAIGAWLWPRRRGWLGPRLTVALAVLPVLIVGGPRVYAEAWFLLALGVASQVAPLIERDPALWRRRLLWSVPGQLGLVLMLAGSVFLRDRLKEQREASRPRPAAAAPNVLLIVLDTVRADRLSLYGYERPTTPTLQRLVTRGIRFDEARATAPWTLASHASFFTGLWPHQLSVRWLSPLRGDFPMLAECLGSRGYATAGFVANTMYCSYDTGLGRGFTHYEDYVLERLGPLRTALLVDGAVKTFSELSRLFDPGLLHPARAFVRRWFFAGERITAAMINRQFLDWLATRREPERPFFAFLNYLDTHTPYILPPGAVHRFGLEPQTLEESLIVFERWPTIDKLRLPPRYLALAGDAYDDCISYLDDQLGRLFDELERRGVLDGSLVIILSDHGEGLGEHGLFTHGESLYRMEIRVPLLILTPSRRPSGKVVREAVSLRDLPATIVDLAGLGANSPFPGQSLARHWAERSAATAPDLVDETVSELEAPNPLDPNQGRSTGHRGPLVSLSDGDLVYIRNEGDGSEELYDERGDPRELANCAHSEAMQPKLRRLRGRLKAIKAAW